MFLTVIRFVHSYLARCYNYTMLDIFRDGGLIQALHDVEDVYILAPGPSADYSLLPRNMTAANVYIPEVYVIAVNAAVNMIPLGSVVAFPNAWMVADRHAPETSWYPHNNIGFLPLRVFSADMPNAEHTFQQNPALGGTAGSGCIHGTLRCNGTVVAQAIQLAYWAGAERCILNGADMYGDHYYDGSKVYDGRKTWRYVDHINPLIEWIHNHSKMRVTSQTKTELAIENNG